ncbi:MAG: hypothetical protein NVS3B16_21920 [Vulcanimicrobiaceae bacterium]
MIVIFTRAEHFDMAADRRDGGVEQRLPFHLRVRGDGILIAREGHFRVDRHDQVARNAQHDIGAA